MIIEDGQVNDGNLESIEKDRDWLDGQMKAQGIKDASEVFVAEWAGDHLNFFMY